MARLLLSTRGSRVFTQVHITTVPVQYAGFIIAFALIGTVTLLLSHAGTTLTTVETERGTISGAASIVADGAASNGAAIRFDGPTKDSYGFSTNYTVVGNHIVDASGNIFVPHGVDRPSTEWNCYGKTVTGADMDGVRASDFVAMHSSWKANIVRIALNQDFWLPGAANYCPSYQNRIMTEVQNAHQAGLRVILDLHWSDAGNLTNNSACADASGGACVGQQCMADQNSVTFWTQVANQFKNDQNTWFELYNEPEIYEANADASWNLWLNGGSVCHSNGAKSYTVAGMQQLYTAVRATGAKNIVLAGAIHYASNFAGISPACGSSGVSYLLKGTNIVYDVHPYYQSGSNTATIWNNNFGCLTSTVPVMATEFGKRTCGTDPYDQDILDYFRTHGMGYSVWAWYIGSNPCTFPSVITDAAGDPATGVGTATQADLQKFASGAQDMTIPGISSPVPTPLNP